MVENPAPDRAGEPENAASHGFRHMGRDAPAARHPQTSSTRSNAATTRGPPTSPVRRASCRSSLQRSRASYRRDCGVRRSHASPLGPADSAHRIPFGVVLEGRSPGRCPHGLGLRAVPGMRTVLGGDSDGHASPGAEGVDRRGLRERLDKGLADRVLTRCARHAGADPGALVRAAGCPGGSTE